MFSSHTFNKTLLSRSSACPTLRFTSQVGITQRSEQPKHQGASFTRESLTTQACIHTSNRRGSCVSLSEFDACFYLFIMFLSHFGKAPAFCPDVCLLGPCVISQVGTIQRSDENKSQGLFFARKPLATQGRFIATYEPSLGLLRTFVRVGCPPRLFVATALLFTPKHSKIVVLRTYVYVPDTTISRRNLAQYSTVGHSGTLRCRETTTSLC